MTYRQLSPPYFQVWKLSSIHVLTLASSGEEEENRCWTHSARRQNPLQLFLGGRTETAEPLLTFRREDPAFSFQTWKACGYYYHLLLLLLWVTTGEKLDVYTAICRPGARASVLYSGPERGSYIRTWFWKKEPYFPCAGFSIHQGDLE